MTSVWQICQENQIQSQLKKKKMPALSLWFLFKWLIFVVLRNTIYEKRQQVVCTIFACLSSQVHQLSFIPLSDIDCLVPCHLQHHCRHHYPLLSTRRLENQKCHSQAFEYIRIGEKRISEQYLAQTGFSSDLLMHIWSSVTVNIYLYDHLSSTSS